MPLWITRSEEPVKDSIFPSVLAPFESVMKVMSPGLNQNLQLFE
jgi:hypothetical protein